jgi:hypothetical protein
MKYAIVGSLTALLAGAGLALAEPPAETLPAPRPSATGTREVPADQATPGGLFGGPGAPGADVIDGANPNFIPPVAIDGTPCRFWARGEYLLWWLSQDHLPSVLTAGNLTGGGVLGQPGTTVLVGGNSLDRDQRSGGQFTLGGWITDYHGFGLEGSFFILEGISRTFSTSGTGAVGTEVISRPFFNLLTGREDAFPVVVPGTSSGTATATSAGVHCDEGRFMGAELHFIGNICCDADCRFDFLIGYRYLSLNDHFAMEQDTLVSPSIFNGFTSSALTILDRFDSSTRFNGGQIGLRGEWRCDRWSVQGTAKVSFGASDESVSIAGETASFASNRPPIVLPGGFLATMANSGSFTNEEFAIVPELNLTVGYLVCDWLKLTLGYNALYWSNVARAGAQIPNAINTLNVPAISGILNSSVTTPPLATIHCNDFWAHGLTAGIELRF